MTNFSHIISKTTAVLGYFVLVLTIFAPQLAKASVLSVEVPFERSSTIKTAKVVEVPALREDGVVEVKPAPNKTLAAVITGYSSTPGQTDDDPFTAASGKRVYDGMVANNCLPFGTKLRFPDLYGDKIFTVDDRMNSRYGCHRFDIWLDQPIAQVRKFGVKRVDVEVYLQVKNKPIKTQVTELAKAN